MNHAAMSSTEYEYPQLGDAFARLWSIKWFLLLWMAAFLALALVYGFGAQKFYKAEMIVAPANPINGAEVSSLLADENLFALRYLVQRVGVGTSSDFTRFENMYAGPSVAEMLLQDENILKGLSMDRAYGFLAPQKNWNAARLSEYLSKRVRIVPIGATPLRKMVYFHPNPEFASYLLTRIHVLTDALIRQTIKAEAIERVQYLSDAVQKTNNPEHRRALTTLLLEQERLRMLVSIDQPYAASVIEPASASDKPQWPDLKLLVCAALVCGFLTGWLVHGFRRRPD